MLPVFPEEGFKKIFEMMFIEHDFKLPMSWVLIGVNGAFLTGRFELSIIGKKFKCIVLNGKANRLRFPINAMFVDAKGKAAHVSFLRTGETGEITPFNISEIPSTSPATA